VCVCVCVGGGRKGRGEERIGRVGSVCVYEEVLCVYREGKGEGACGGL
jgi:hypothetical protein